MANPPGPGPFDQLIGDEVQERVIDTIQGYLLDVIRSQTAIQQLCRKLQRRMEQSLVNMEVQDRADQPLAPRPCDPIVPAAPSAAQQITNEETHEQVPGGEAQKLILFPPESHQAQESVPHHEIHGVMELGKYLASADHVISLCGTPSPDMRYGIIVVPVNDEKVLIRGYGEAKAERVPEEGATSQEPEERENVEQKRPHKPTLKTAQSAGQCETRFDRWITSQRNEFGTQVEQQEGQSNQGSRGSRRLLQGVQNPVAQDSIVQAPREDNNMVKDMVTTRFLSAQARNIIETILEYDALRQAMGFNASGRSWKAMREKRKRRRSDSYDLIGQQQETAVLCEFQRNVFLQVSEVLTLLGRGAHHTNPGISPETWEAAVKRATFPSLDEEIMECVSLEI